ncbi:diacylglycerol kinase family lipid kinase [Vallitaleaceae bacterium 9-2]|mgnify:CR=1 FL=1
MKKHVFIVNTKAGKGKAKELLPYIEELFENPQIHQTQYLGHAIELAKENAGPDTIIYSLGGDGTLNEVVHGVMLSQYSKETIVGIIPCGSGNDFIKSITSIRDPKVLLDQYREGNRRTIDVGVLNGRHYINIASVGFDAEIVHNAKKYKRLPMFSAELAYLISVFATILKLKVYPVNIQVDGKALKQKEVLLISLANAKYYGGGMKPSPKAVFDDGYLDFCVIERVSKIRVPFLLPKYIHGTHEKIKQVQMYRGKSLTIKSQDSLPINIDGEIIWNDQLDVTIKENALTILVL